MNTDSLTVCNKNCKQILLELGFSPHLAGYKQLKCGILQFALDDRQCLTFELYPLISQKLNCSGASAIERSIRRSIALAWKNGSQREWEKYFPGYTKPPTNKQFIAVIAELIK